MDPMFRAIQALMDPNFRLKIKCKEGYKCQRRLDLINEEIDATYRERGIPVYQDPTYDPKPFIRANKMLRWHITHCKTCSEHIYDPQGVATTQKKIIIPDHGRYPPDGLPHAPE